MPTLIDYLLAANWVFAALVSKTVPIRLIRSAIEHGHVHIINEDNTTNAIDADYILKEGDNLWFTSNGEQEEVSLQLYEQRMRYVNGEMRE